MPRYAILFALVLLTIAPLRAQLVITEVMSNASTNLGAALVPQNSDFWELSNFGSTAIDLTGYRWNDNSGGLAGADSTPFAGLVIGPGESVIFVESSTTANEAQFREWWGAQLPATVQIRFYTGNGFGNSGDGVRLWAPTATTDAETAASVDFGAAFRGVTFTYSPVTGAFGILSTNGMNGAFKAATADDVGSPGINTGPVVSAAPTIQTPLVNQTVYNNQNATFTVVAAGSPTPTYHWLSNGVPIPGANTNSYTIFDAQFYHTGTYTVVVSNSAGTATSQASLTVTRRPNLVITEVSSAQSATPPTDNHSDWWELTNLDDFAVDLFGYRFDDASRSLSSAITITNHIVISPGESVVFVDTASADAFRQWWGPANLRSNLQVITYTGSGIGLSASGDELHLWNQGAIIDTDIIAGAIFGAATPGVTFTYNPATETFGELSVAGQNGAFTSVESGDIGSPGVIRASDGFGNIAISRSGAELSLTWTGPIGRNYRVEYKDDLNAATWNVLTTVTSTSTTTTLPLSMNSPTGQRYYQVILLP